MADGKTKKRRLSLHQKRKLQGSLFLLPVVLGLALVFLPAIVLSIRMSLSDLKIMPGGYELTFNNLSNYRRTLFEDPYFITLLVNSFTQYDAVWIHVLVIIVFSLFMATVLNQKFKGRVVARVILFLPVILCTGLVNRVDAISAAQLGGGATIVTGVDLGTIGGFDFMQLEDLLREVGLMTGLVDLLIGLVNSLYTIVISSGVQILVFLAGLQSISPSLYEAGQVDGITAWQAFWKITIPMISPLILVNIIYSIINYLTDVNNPVMTYIERQMQNISAYPLGAAYSWIYFAIMGVLVALVMLVSRRLVFYNN